VSDIEKKFHEFALKSILFKGRTDWYFCYLKAERIAHVLAMLLEQSEVKDREMAYKIVSAAAELPHTITHFAAGEVDAPIVVADIFSLLSRVRLAATHGLIGRENSAILLGEFEMLAERFALSVHPSPFASAEDFSVPDVDAEHDLEGARGHAALGTPGNPHLLQGQNYKGQSKGQNPTTPKGHTARMDKILVFLKENQSSSIKDIAVVVRNCSEKTIQRELAILIQEGLVKKVGERRWSVYIAL
jgi:hypothetical protein